MMETTYNLRPFCYVMYGAIIHILLVASVKTNSVHLGPAEVFRQFSDVIFPGEVFILQCVWDGLTTCNISMFFNDISIYEEGGFQSQEYVFAQSKSSSSCSLDIKFNNVTIQHKGIYKCREQNGDTTTEDTYNLNVVTEWPQCLAKCNEYDNSFQLFCYTFSPTGHHVLQSWEIIEPGVGFTEFTVQTVASNPVLKSVGVSNENINKENLTGTFKCSHSNDLSKNCSFYVTFSREIDVSANTTISKLETRPLYSMSTLSHTSPPLTTHNTIEQPQMKPLRNSIIIVISATVVFLILFVCLVVIIYKMKNNTFGKGTQQGIEPQRENELVQTGTVIRSPNNTTLVSSTTTEDSTDSKYKSYAMNTECGLPEDLYKKIERRCPQNNDQHSSSQELQDGKYKSYIRNSKSKLPDDLYKRIEKRGIRYQGNQSPGRRCEPYLTVSIDDIDQSIVAGAHSENGLSIKTTDMVGCSAYEPFGSEKTEEEIHYDVLDPSKEDNLE